MVGAGTGIVRDTMAGVGDDSGSGVRSPTRRRPERIAEEEGWEVVNDDSGADDGFG